MKILSIDTCSNICGVSILEDTSLIYNSDKNTDRTHSENLMPMIDEAFKSSNISLPNIDLLVADIGPGSFTGLRIGVATIKAFRDSLNIPTIGISSLEVLAYNLKNLLSDGNLITSFIDCKNDNCYFALYQKLNNSINVLISPSSDTIQNALANISSFIDSNNLTTNKLTFVGDGSEKYRKEISSIFPFANFANNEFNFVSSYSLGLAGLDNYNNRANKNFEDILPLYLKKPQAQRLLEEKEKEMISIKKD